MSLPTLPFLVVLLLTGAPAFEPSQTAVPSGPDADELAVMTVVLDAAWSRSSHGWVMLAAHTATFECNPAAPTGFELGGCGGMRVGNQTAEEMLAAVRGAMPRVSVDVAADLLAKSRRSTDLAHTLEVPITQILWAPDLPTTKQPEGDPEFVAYFSRVGFDAKRRRALVYLGTVHWTDQTRSVGQYLYLEKDSGKWAIKDHFKVWDLGQPAS